MKVGFYHPPDAAVVPSPITSVEDFVAECMPGLRGAATVDVAEASGVDTCFYDLVGDDDFILGPVPGAGGVADSVFVGVGWRGTGYKFAPWVGRDCAVAAQPVPYRTSPAMPTMESLRADGGDRVFPLALEPYSCTRFDMAAFAGAARDLGVNYIGVCCGGAPHQVRAMAEALGRQVPASKYAPAMELHPILGVAGAAADPNVLAAWNVAG